MSNVEDIFAPDIFAPGPDIAPPTGAGYVVCELDRVSIAVPQIDIHAIEHGGELAAPLPGENAYGWFACEQGPWPVFALNDRLEVTQHVLQPRSFVLFLKSSPFPRGLLARSVRIVGKKSDLATQPLPYPLRAYAPGVSGVARVDGARLLYAFEPSRVIELFNAVETQWEAAYA
jgi:hypothetical protein